MIKTIREQSMSQKENDTKEEASALSVGRNHLSS